jgi:predicted nucleic acid-binding protein
VNAGVVLDASVAVKAVVSEPGSERALAALAASGGLVAPSLILVEVANALRKRAAAREMEAGEARQAFSDFLLIRMLRVEIDEALADQALALSLELRHPVQDCLYLALAVRRGLRVLTADVRFAAAAGANAEMARHILPLEKA